ncbi:MAG: bacillithiol biosynthesis deacetylase BshB1 [Exiguobacterium sp.]|uniref:bacillithiol biosynthesis deacetylase BshB1 n=1 Tax=Exiguobacterium TaxID=33986 RepID=UPI0004A8C007|nr:MULTISPECIES: bacillithiol biosynthesis deacetylase BshB1 [unclassified Exiguobacterium]KDN57321.1 deacetylase [Exiguobacterium sp. AB2]MDX5324565.1 bacillithiol biosynthesis deacetylase BshB1 [Exiguobacterium sp.]MDX5426409.1 bacillithiol biosynthesis deacetylase BshB1 [Exiguobacterium sp.]MDX6773785.1 bacillithiol biosynthesis deacetylase BshB1 [Exiguobacterium sp.]
MKIVAIGAHPDDIEIGIAGMTAQWRRDGIEVVYVDLTRAELSSNGDVDTRAVEAGYADDVLGVRRLNLGFPDRGLTGDEIQIETLVRLIRTERPTHVLYPYGVDRHPDHRACARLVEEALFNAGIRKYLPDVPAYRPDSVYQYMINALETPDVCIDISETMETKLRALSAYESQFMPVDGVRTPLTDEYIERVRARERHFGSLIGTTYAEGLMTVKPYAVRKAGGLA